MTRPLLLAAAALLLAGCDEVPNPAAPDTPRVAHAAAAERAAFDPRQVTRGEALYMANCATCHGLGAEGHPTWRQRTAEGRWLPPPLNGTGHSWHHPYPWLVQKIKQGSPPGLGDMPPWGDRLSDQQIADIIAWFQSIWPAEVYAAWEEMDQRARTASR